MSTLYIMIGPAACGKSTLALKYKTAVYMSHDCVIISSDAVRGELYGDESVQKDHARVFSICHERMKDALSAGTDVIFDATNLIPKNRINLIEMAREAGCDCVIGVVYTGGLGECLERNAQRSRKVPEGVIRNMYDTLKRYPPSFDEGFDAFVRTDGPLTILG